MNRYSFHFEMAVLVSLLLHVMTFGCWEYRSTLARFSLFKPIAALATMLRPPAYPSPEKPAEEQTITFMPAPESRTPQEAPKQFMETDSSQVTGEQPKNARYYSDKATVAANAENPTGKNGATPYLAGKETRIMSTENVMPGTGAGGSRPMASPARPSPPPAPPSAAQKAAAKAQQQPPAPKAEQPKQVPAKGLALVEEKKLVMAQPEIESVPHAAPANVPREPVPPAQPALAAAAGIPGSDREIVAAKSHLVAAGVSRSGVTAFNVEGSPFGAYDKQIIAAVQSRWYALIEKNQLGADGAGRVVVQFQLLQDGSVQGVKTTESTVGVVLSSFCELAILESAPFEPWPEKLQVLLGKEPRDVIFTFDY